MPPVSSRPVLFALVSFFMTLSFASQALAMEDGEYRLSDVGSRIEIPASDLTCSRDTLKTAEGAVKIDWDLTGIKVTCSEFAQAVSSGSLALTIIEVGEAFHQTRRREPLWSFEGLKCKIYFNKKQALRVSFELSGQTYHAGVLANVGKGTEKVPGFRVAGEACPNWY